jgi:hypothetical protein
MMDFSGDEGVSLSVFSPTPRPMASAAMTARRTKHGQKVNIPPPPSFLVSLFASASVLGGAADGAVGTGARTVRPS